MAKVCAICENKVGLNRNTIADKESICKSCLMRANLSPLEILKLRKFTADDLKLKIGDNPTGFGTTKKIGPYVHFDDREKKWGLPSLGVVISQNSYDYSDVIGVELLEDGETVAKGGVGRALVGGALFGGTGAIVGAVTRKGKDVCKSLKVKVTIRNMNKPAVFITFLDKKTKKDNPTYKKAYQQAQECLSAFQIICDQKNY